MSLIEIEIFEEEGEKTLSISDDHHDITFDFFPDKKEFKQRLRLKEDVYYRNELYEYKINTNPIEVFIRLKERSDEPPLRHAVKDGVVLEAEIIKDAKMPSGHIMNMTKELIANLKKEVEWNKLQLPGGYAQIFYILSLHPEILSKDEYKKFLRQTEQRIKSGVAKIEEKVKEKDKTGLQILEGEYGKQIWYSESEKISDEDQDKKIEYIEKTFNVPLFDEKSPDYCGISKYEFQESPFVLKHIENLLNKKEMASQKKVNGEEKISKKKGFIISLLLTLFISWVVSWFVDINPFLIFILVQVVAFLQSILGGWVGKMFE